MAATSPRGNGAERRLPQSGWPALWGRRRDTAQQRLLGGFLRFAARVPREVTGLEGPDALQCWEVLAAVQPDGVVEVLVVMRRIDRQECDRIPRMAVVQPAWPHSLPPFDRSGDGPDEPASGMEVPP